MTSPHPKQQIKSPSRALSPEQTLKQALEILPASARRHLAVPRYAWIFWMIVASVYTGRLLFARGTATPIRSSEPQGAVAAAPAPAEAPQSHRIEVKGRSSFSLTYNAARSDVTASTSTHPNLRLEKTADGEIKLVAADGSTAYRLKPKVTSKDEDKAKLYDAKGRLAYSLKEGEDDSKLKIRDAAGKDLYRLKIKDDKFNIYNGGGQRIGKGKYKNGSYQVTSETSNDVIATITGAASLDEAAYFGLPLEAGYQILIWHAYVE